MDRWPYGGGGHAAFGVVRATLPHRSILEAIFVGSRRGAQNRTAGAVAIGSCWGGGGGGGAGRGGAGTAVGPNGGSSRRPRRRRRGRPSSPPPNPPTHGPVTRQCSRRGGPAREILGGRTQCFPAISSWGAPIPRRPLRAAIDYDGRLSAAAPLEPGAPAGRHLIHGGGGVWRGGRELGRQLRHPAPAPCAQLLVTQPDRQPKSGGRPDAWRGGFLSKPRTAVARGRGRSRMGAGDEDGAAATVDATATRKPLRRSTAARGGRPARRARTLPDAAATCPHGRRVGRAVSPH